MTANGLAAEGKKAFRHDIIISASECFFALHSTFVYCHAESIFFNRC